MKILLILLFTLFSFKTEKTFTVKFSEAVLNKHWAKLNTIKTILNESNLPHQQVVFMIQSIDSLQLDIQSQVKSQIDTVKKK